MKRSNKRDTKQALKLCFGDKEFFSDYKFHGNIKWCAINLCNLALLFALSDKRCVTAAASETFNRCEQLSIDSVPTTYQGLMGALEDYCIPLLRS